MANKVQVTTTSVCIDNDPYIRTCKIRSDNDAVKLTIDIDQADLQKAHARGVIVVNISPEALAPHVCKCNPQVMKAHTVHDHMTNAQFGPFLNEETAKHVAKGRGEWGTDGSVFTNRYVTWTDNATGRLVGHQVLCCEAIELSAAEPDAAAVEAVLSKLSAEQRAIMERALGRNAIGKKQL